ncbi:ester cyclase [Arthrobacter mobilis]|uniref:Ester cyclase n=1 Tax=Arthrobacter mobilis TaxID=2724944 RepID=A0A7X6K6C5_9MICC|nr:ester cyclase [Arthrobacter mobilis]NKX55539.1 ester cyclase [Arthrobacter mobilis]
MAGGSGIIERFYREVMEGGHLDLIDELGSENAIDHEDPLPGQPSGLDGVKFFVNTFRSAFPDIRAKAIEPVMTDGDMEAARIVLTGTHQGEFLGIAPTGNTVEFSGIDMIRVQDGKAVEHWGATDMFKLMQQIGAIQQ